MACVQFLVDISDFVRNIALTIFSGITSWIAYSGFKVWKEQKVFDKQFDYAAQVRGNCHALLSSVKRVEQDANLNQEDFDRALLEGIQFVCGDVRRILIESKQIEKMSGELFERLPLAIGYLSPLLENHTSLIIQTVNQLQSDILFLKVSLFKNKKDENDIWYAPEFDKSELETIKEAFYRVRGWGNEITVARKLSEAISNLEIFLEPWLNRTSKLKSD